MAPALQWRTSSYSGTNGSCVQVADAPNGAGVLVRDSKDPNGPRLAATSTEWRSLIRMVRQY